MACVKSITLALISICIMQDILQVSTQARKGHKERKGKGKQRHHILTTTSKPVSSHLDQNRRALEHLGGDGEVFKGRFSNKNRTQCTWAAMGGNVEDAGMFVLSINCKKGTEHFNCEYKAKPRLCPQYASRANAYWKQIERSLKKQNTLCHDPKVKLKAGLCRKAPKDAHFTLNNISTVQPKSGKKNKNCPNLANRQKLAKEYCGKSWSSFCTFFFAMVESDNC